jgi:hypothetical protein
VRRHLALGVVLVSSLALAACGSEESSDSGTVAQAVAGQLAYLEPESALVVAVDLRYEEENWERLRAVGDRLIDEAREVAEPGELGPLPRDSEAALKQYVGLSGADFEEDVRPRLDGHLVIGLAPEPGAEAGDGVPATHVTTVYRTEEGGLREVLGRFMDGAALRPAPGHDDVVVTEDGVAVVGDDTLIAADTRERALAAVERAEAGQGLSPELVAAAERATGLDDPLVLATGTPDLARDFPLAEELERARAEVPYLAAVERIDMALDVREDAVEATAAVATTAGQLEEGDLPLGPAGEVEVPVPENAIAGGSLDQSRITTFAAKVMRSAFADSDFVAAVEETERELGIRFEEEVLRQFDCPSVSLLEPGEGALLGTGGRFSARSCVRDPERMRELLPELAPRLPRILTAMRGLGGGGLLGLLLVAPDAPLTPRAGPAPDRRGAGPRGSAGGAALRGQRPARVRVRTGGLPRARPGGVRNDRRRLRGGVGPSGGTRRGHARDRARGRGGGKRSPCPARPAGGGAGIAGGRRGAGSGLRRPRGRLLRRCAGDRGSRPNAARRLSPSSWRMTRGSS